jgi:integrase
MAQQGYTFKAKGSWYLRYRDNFLIDGVLVRKQKCIRLTEVSDRFKNESDLADLIAEKLAKVREAAKCPRSSESFTDYVENTWLPYVERNMKPSTFAGYRSYFERYIKPHVKNRAVRDFTVSIVAKLLKDVANTHTMNTATIGKVRSILSGIFSFAISEGTYPARSAEDNPASKAMIPEAATKPKPTKAATRGELKAILAILHSDGHLFERAAIALIAYTGVRPGECRGLRWEEWDRVGDQIAVVRSVWHAKVGTPKTEQSVRFIAVVPELRTILRALWEAQGCPSGGYILGRSGGRPSNLDNMVDRVIVPALSRCVVCKQAEAAKHEGHEFQRDESVPKWISWYSVRRFHGTVVRQECGSSETGSKALGNSKAVFDRHDDKPTEVPSDVRKAVNGATRGLIQ